MEGFRYFICNNVGTICKLKTQENKEFPFRLAVYYKNGQKAGYVNMPAAQVEENIRTEYWKEIPAAEWVLLFNFL